MCPTERKTVRETRRKRQHLANLLSNSQREVHLYECIVKDQVSAANFYCIQLKIIMKKSSVNENKPEEQILTEKSLTTPDEESCESKEGLDKEKDSVERGGKRKKEKADTSECSRKAKKARKKKKKVIAYFKIELEEDQPISLKIINRLINHFKNVLISFFPLPYLLFC